MRAKCQTGQATIVLYAHTKDLDVPRQEITLGWTRDSVLEEPIHRYVTGTGDARQHRISHCIGDMAGKLRVPGDIPVCGRGRVIGEHQTSFVQHQCSRTHALHETRVMGCHQDSAARLYVVLQVLDRFTLEWVV